MGHRSQQRVRDYGSNTADIGTVAFFLSSVKSATPELKRHLGFNTLLEQSLSKGLYKAHVLFTSRQNSQVEMSSSTGDIPEAEAHPLTNDKYTVGWIAALPHEAIAAKAALDDFYRRRPFTKHASDQNSYILGQISDYNVVIASLPGEVIGPTSASITAIHILASFPSIRIGLIVGIGAGIPKIKKDRKTNKNRNLRNIQLHNIIVSQPGSTHGGVKQYDFGKAIAGGGFQPSGFLNSPPRALLNAVGVLRQLHEGGESDMPTILNQVLENLNNATPSYEYPGPELDRLFEVTYILPLSSYFLGTQMLRT